MKHVHSLRPSLTQQTFYSLHPQGSILFFTSSGFYLDNKEAAAESYSSCTVCPAGKSCPNEGMSAGDMCPEVSYLFLKK